MREIVEEDVKNALKEDFAELEEIHRRILTLHDELTNINSMIQSVALKSPKYGSIGSGGGTKKADLTEIMIKHERLQRQREIEIRDAIFHLTEEEEQIHRIRVCYQTLRGKQYRYLQELYVLGRQYKEVERDSGVSHAAFERTRKSGIKKIIQLYASNFSNQEIIAQASRQKRQKKRKKKEEGKIYEQLSLNIEE